MKGDYSDHDFLRNSQRANAFLEETKCKECEAIKSELKLLKGELEDARCTIRVLQGELVVRGVY